MKEMLLFMQRTNLRPSDDEQKLNISMLVMQRAFRVTMKVREWKKRRVKVSLFERKIPCHVILLATSRLRASRMFRNDPGVYYSAPIRI